MDTIYYMISAMGAVGLYDLTPGSHIYNEMRTYAESFDALYEAIDDILDECFIQTADDIGLEMYEELTGRIRDDLTLEKRREMALALVNIKPDDFTPDGAERFFDSLGLECEITEYPQNFEMLIIPTAGEYSRSEQERIRERAEEFMPCHITCTVEFRDADWDTYDGLDNTFDDWDALDFTWNALDRYEGE